MIKTLLTASLLTFPALANAAPSALTYEQFEYSVQHVDLDLCPMELAEPGRFCRATINHDEIHVFVFDDNGDQPLIGYHAYSAEKLDTILR